MTENIKSVISELETIRDNYDWRDYVTDECYDDCLKGDPFLAGLGRSAKSITQMEK